MNLPGMSCLMCNVNRQKTILEGGLKNPSSTKKDIMKAKAKKIGKMNDGKYVFCRKNKIYEVVKTSEAFCVKDEIGVTSSGGVHTMSPKFFNEYFTIIT